MEKPYRDFADFLHERFPDFKVQKIAINAGFTCPNRDGSKGIGGCTYCNNQTFNPEYCRPSLSVAEQVEQGKAFFSRKYPDMKYLAYFQAYTNTYGELKRLQSLYEEALGCTDVVGLIIGTRPDCMPDDLLCYLKDLSQRAFVMVEYGAESANDTTLELINRGHTWADTVDAVTRTHAAGIACGLHLILGLPGETVDDMLHTVDQTSLLPIDTVKLHQLQIIRGTRLARQVAAGEVTVAAWDVDEYIDLCVKIVARMRRDIAIERFVSQSPAELLISPRWGLKNYQFTNLLHNALRKAAGRQSIADCGQFQ